MILILQTILSIKIDTDCESYVGYQKEVQNKTVSFFEGIAYAKPPVDGRRWQPSELIDCGKGEINATKRGKSCHQLLNLLELKEDEVSEDCLFLNIYLIENKSQKPNKKKSVIVFLHGGSIVIANPFCYGSLYNLLLHDEDIILVTLNYRLNIFGFLALEALKELDSRKSSGNYGITDQQTALRWIQKNIEYFGGNKDSVTLIGQSSGGTSIFALLASNDSKGLFHNAISLSGSPNITMPLAQAQKNHYEDVVRNSICDPEKYNIDSVYSCLMKLSGQEVLKLAPLKWYVSGEFNDNKHNGSKYPGLVIVDGSTVNLPIHEALQFAINDVNLIVQVLEQELELLPCEEALRLLNYTYSDFEKYLKNKFSSWNPKNPDLVGDTLIRLYDNKKQNVKLMMNSIISDIVFTCGNIYLAKTAGTYFKSNVYFNIVKQRPSHPISIPFPPFQVELAFHDWDLIAASEVFHTFFYGEYEYPHYEPNESDLLFGYVLRRSWFDLMHKGKADNLHTISKYDHTYKANVYENDSVFAVENYKKDICHKLHKLGFDEKFWVTN